MDTATLDPSQRQAARRFNLGLLAVAVALVAFCACAFLSMAVWDRWEKAKTEHREQVFRLASLTLDYNEALRRHRLNVWDNYADYLTKTKAQQLAIYPNGFPVGEIALNDPKDGSPLQGQYETNEDYVNRVWAWAEARISTMR